MPNTIKLYSDEAPEELYRAVYQALAARGHEIKESNAEMMTVSTEFNEVGQET